MIHFTIKENNHMEAKKIRYKGIEVDKPENISLNMVKRIVDELGRDGCMSANDIVQFI